MMADREIGSSEAGGLMARRQTEGDTRPRFPRRSFRPMLPPSRRLPGIVSCALFFCSVALSCRCAAGAPKSVELRNRTWRVSVDPESLAVWAVPSRKRPVQVSAPQTGLGPATHLEQTTRQARWELPQKGATVSVRFEEAALTVSIVSSAAG